MKRIRMMLLAPLLALGAAGCVVTAAGAGAAAAIAYTGRGARSLVDAPLPEVLERARAVFRDQGIEVVAPDDDATENDVTLAGRRGDQEIRVEMERETDATTDVQVLVWTSPVEWNRQAARDLLRRIVARR